MSRDFPDQNTMRERRIMTKRLKRKKRKRITVFLLIVFCLAAFLAAGGYLLFTEIQKKTFNVKHVEVIGNETVDSKTVIDAAGIPDDADLFTLNMNQIEQNVRAGIDCNYLMISKKFPDTILINIRESPVICAIMEEERIYYLNDRYELVETGSYLTRTDIPLVVGLSGCSSSYVGRTANLAPTQKAEEIRQILIILNNSDYIRRLSEIDVKSDGSLLIITKNNLVIHFNDLAQFKREYDYIGSILEKNKSNQEVDFTLGDKIIVKNR